MSKELLPNEWTCEWSAEPKLLRLRACVFFLHLCGCITAPEKRVVLERVKRKGCIIDGDAKVFRRSHRKKT